MSNSTAHDSEYLSISETLQGNNDAFKPLVEKYWGMVAALVHRYIKNRETAADLCQEAFITAFTSLGQYRHQHSFAPWLAKIAVNKALEHLRRVSRAPLADVDLSYVISPAVSPEAACDQQQLYDDCLASLPEKLQVMFILRHGLEFSYEEMAYVLDQPLGTVKSLMFRLRGQLKTFLESRDRCEQASAGEGLEPDAG